MKKIMFSDRYGLTQAVLDGRKTMTRRMIKAPKKMEGKDVYGFSVAKRPGSDEWIEVMALDEDEGMINNILPKYKPGDVVAVAQNYEDAGYARDTIQRAKFRTDQYDGWQVGDFKICLLPGWKNKMFVLPTMMPHQIRITNIRIERLQDISEEDCLREGVCRKIDAHKNPTQFCGFKGTQKLWFSPREAFATLIDKVSGEGTWESNPWVFVYEFELVK